MVTMKVHIHKNGGRRAGGREGGREGGRGNRSVSFLASALVLYKEGMLFALQVVGLHLLLILLLLFLLLCVEKTKGFLNT